MVMFCKFLFLFHFEPYFLKRHSFLSSHNLYKENYVFNYNEHKRKLTPTFQLQRKITINNEVKKAPGS